MRNHSGARTRAAYSGRMAGTSRYERTLRDLQIKLVRHQSRAMARGDRAVILFEGRDGAGKDGAIQRVTEHLAPRNTRAISLPKPSDRERSEWYFQRYVRRLPAAGEIVIFNRSWYNRGGVEPVMGFCTSTEHDAFLRDAPDFERMLQESGIRLIKFWLDISREEQARRLQDRREDPLKQLKISDLDGFAQKKWREYSSARNEMLMRTHTPLAPWFCVRADDKKAARLAVIRQILAVLADADLSADMQAADPDILFGFEPAALTDGRLHP